MNADNLTIHETVHFPRSLLPVQSVRRSIPLFSMVFIVVVVAGSIMGGNGFTYMLAYLVSSVSVLAALRYGLPSKIVISGSQRNIIAARAVTLIEQSSIGFRYTKAADNQRWKMPGPDIYPWDPSVRIEYGADKISITGPGCTMSLLLVKLRRE